jgi:DNA-binding GntR family transcriptional regulator
MFQRKPLREDLHKEILARIGDGRLPAGQRINESRLSADLGISRTPLREAMLGLEAQGFLGSDMGRGFLVPMLCSEEFIEIQAVLSHLKPFALSLALPVPPPRIMELQNLLKRAQMKAREISPDRAVALTDLVYRWSHLVLGTCTNRTLTGDILRLEGLSRRYWHEAVVLDFDPTDFFVSLNEVYELLRMDKREESVSYWRGHIERFSGEAARVLPTRPVSI